MPATVVVDIVLVPLIKSLIVRALVKPVTPSLEYTLPEIVVVGLEPMAQYRICLAVVVAVVKFQVKPLLSKLMGTASKFKNGLVLFNAEYGW